MARFALLALVCISLFSSCRRKTVVKVQIVHCLTKNPVAFGDVTFSIIREYIPAFGSFFDRPEKKGQHTTRDDGSMVIDFRDFNDKYIYSLQLEDTADFHKNIFDTITEHLPLYTISPHRDNWSVGQWETNSYKVLALPVSRFKIVIRDTLPFNDNNITLMCSDGSNTGEYQTKALSYSSKGYVIDFAPIYRPLQTTGVFNVYWTITGKNGVSAAYSRRFAVDPFLKNSLTISL